MTETADGLSIERVALDDLHEDPANVRLHPDRNMEAVKASLLEFGQAEPLVVSAGGKVIGGNARLRAMRALGWESCDVVRLDLDPAQEAALGIALNRTAELAEWDHAALAAMVEGMDYALVQAAGYSDEELQALVERVTGPEAPSDFGDADESRTDFKCPKCGYEWDGQPRPGDGGAEEGEG